MVRVLMLSALVALLMALSGLSDLKTGGGILGPKQPVSGDQP